NHSISSCALRLVHLLVCGAIQAAEACPRTQGDSPYTHAERALLLLRREGESLNRRPDPLRNLAALHGREPGQEHCKFLPPSHPTKSPSRRFCWIARAINCRASSLLRHDRSCH